VFLPQIQKVLDELNGEWYAFQQCLMDSDIMLKKSKEKFKSGLLLSAEEFKKTVSILLDDFRNRGPFNSEISTERVREYAFQYFILNALMRISSVRRYTV
jgi:dynein heavy chain